MILAIVAAVVVGAAFLLGGLGAPEQVFQGSETATSQPTPGVEERPVCIALAAADTVHGRYGSQYLRALENNDAASAQRLHELILDDMLGIADALYQGSADESEFTTLELTIGEWMEAWDGAMTHVDAGFSSQQAHWFETASEQFARVDDQWGRMQSLRTAAGC